MVQYVKCKRQLLVEACMDDHALHACTHYCEDTEDTPWYTLDRLTVLLNSSLRKYLRPLNLPVIERTPSPCIT